VAGGQGRFATTRWSVVASAGRSHSAESRDALAALCETYWFPLYAFVRRQGYSADDAQDLIQSFFARLLEDEIAQTLAGPEEFEDELRHLLSAVAV